MIVKIILFLLSSSLTLSLLAVDKTQYAAYLNLNSILQLIDGISNDLQKLLKYFHRTEIDALFINPLFIASFGVVCAILVSNDFALYLTDLKLLSLAISKLKSIALSLE